MPTSKPSNFDIDQACIPVLVYVLHVAGVWNIRCGAGKREADIIRPEQDAGISPVFRRIPWLTN